MANGFVHKSMGTSLTQAEYEEEGTGHIFESQATGDMAYASSSTVIRRLAIGSNTAVMPAASGIPAWNTNIAIATNGQLTSNAGVVIDNITIDGTTIALSSGTLLFDVAANIDLDSGAGIWTFKDGGTEVLRLTESGTGDVTIKLVTNAKDLIFTDNGNAEGFRILDGAVGVKVPGEVQTTEIAFTDGDAAMTIVDGGAVTFPAGIANSGTIAAGTWNGTAIGSSYIADAYLINSGNDTTSGIVTAAGFTLAEAANFHIGTPLLASTDHTYSGITATMLAGGAISAFDLVCIHTTTQEIVEADASAIATARVIGIAPAAISDTASGTVLLHGFIRDDTWNWTPGSPLYLSETAGAMTHTAPTTDGAFVQVVGIALSPDVVYFKPSMDIIEHA